jgi:hypothetical protein
MNIDIKAFLEFLLKGEIRKGRDIGGSANHSEAIDKPRNSDTNTIYFSALKLLDLFR